MIVRNSVLLAFFAGISLILGVVRDRFLAQLVGVGPLLDVYNAAFRIPDFTLAILLSFASATTVVPFLTKAVHDGDHHELSRRFSSLFIFFGGVMIILGILVILLLPHLTSFVVPGFSSEQVDLYIKTASILMIQPLLLGLSTLISSLAQVRHQFVVYSLAPLVYTFAIVLSVFLYPSYGFTSLTYGVVIGAVFHILIQSYTLIKQGIHISFHLFDKKLIKDHLLFAAPRSGSFMVSRVRDIVIASIATTFGVGALSIYVFAQRIIDAYLQLVVQSLSTATLPRLALHHAKGETLESTHLIQKSVSYIVGFSLLTMVFIWLFKTPLLVLLYSKNAPIEEIGHLLVLLSVGMPMLAVNYYFTSAFNASKNNVPVFISNLTATVLGLIALWYMKVRGVGISSIGFSSILMSFIVLLMLQWFYSRNRRLPQTS